MSWLNSIIGQGIAANIGACGQFNSAQQAYSPTQQQAMAAQQQQAYNMSQGQMNGTGWQPPQWMFKGQILNFQEFVEKIFPEDCAEKTAFVLKYSE